MIQLLRPANPETLAADIHKAGLWIPKTVVILSTPGPVPKVLLLKTPDHKLKSGEEASWAPPQRRKRAKDSIMGSGRRNLREEVGITNKGLSPIGVLGYRNRAFQQDRPLPVNCPATAQGWSLFYLHFQIESEEVQVKLCPQSAADYKFADEGEYVELIRKASPVKQRLTNYAVVSGGVFPTIPMRL